MKEANIHYPNGGSYDAGKVTLNTTVVTGDGGSKDKWFKIGNIVIAPLEFTPNNNQIASGKVICTGLPNPIQDSLFCFNDKGRNMIIRGYGAGNGQLAFWFPTATSDYSRINITLVYLTDE